MSNENQPNILLFFTDMQRADTIHALGNDVIKTPNLDRIVKRGTAFTKTYSPSPVCIPARYSMHYGTYPVRTGLAENWTMPDDNGKSIPALLEKVGYETAAIGKCHFTPDKAALRGFGSRLIQEEGCSDPDADDYCRWLTERGVSCDEPHGTRGEMYYIPQISLKSEEEHPSNWIGDRTIDFISSKEDSAKPWFLFSSFIHPHPPFAPPKPWHKLYRSPDMPYPFVSENPEDGYTWINRKQNRYKYRDQGIDKQLMRNIKAYYYATISFVDYQIGRILDDLERTGQLENTVIMFASDHGEYLGDYNCFGKRGMHDASARVPLVASFPGVFPENEVCTKATSLVDVLPTVLQIAGVECDMNGYDGVSLQNIANGKSGRKYVFSQHEVGDNALHMATDGKFKYVWSAGDQKEFFYDMNEDPHEINNCIDDGRYASEISSAKSALFEFLNKHDCDNISAGEDGQLDWKKNPLHDESKLQKDPNAFILYQDHELQASDIHGYAPDAKLRSGFVD